MRSVALMVLASLAILGGWRERASTPEMRLSCRQPQLAASGDDVFVACGTASGSIMVSRSAMRGRQNGGLTTIANAGALALGNHRGPRVALAGNAVVVSAIIGRRDAKPGTSGDVTVWRSEDDGQTWSQPIIVNDTRDAAREGLHAIAADGNRVVLAWLDLRTPTMQLMTATSLDGGKSWAPDRLAYASSHAICTCCHPSVVVSGARVIAMFRNDHGGARDMFVVESNDGGATWEPATKLGVGTWPLTMCPMDGGALELDVNGRIVASWRREQTVYVGGEGREVGLGAGVNPAMTLVGSTLVVAWNGPEGLLAKWGEHPASVLDPRGKFAAIDASDQQVVIAFEVGNESVIRTLSAPGGTAP